jgi:hypothetical protein
VNAFVTEGQRPRDVENGRGLRPEETGVRRMERLTGNQAAEEEVWIRGVGPGVGAVQGRASTRIPGPGLPSDSPGKDRYLPCEPNEEAGRVPDGDGLPE